jgi:hypothetical protein
VSPPHEARGILAAGTALNGVASRTDGSRTCLSGVATGDTVEKRLGSERHADGSETTMRTDEPADRQETERDIDPEVPEADALEQRRPADAGDIDIDADMTVPPDAPEADALEQSRAVPADDDIDR